MGTDNLFWKRKNQKLKRKSKGKGKPPKLFLIVCEGEKTEPNYFRSFKLTSANVTVEGCGRNTVSLIKKAIDIRSKAEKDDEIYDQVWCVFDRDSFPLHNFNEAISLAGRNDINVAYSNEAFELWYLLHFHYYDSGITRAKYKRMLTQHQGRPYKKNSLSMYDQLKENQGDALKNAERLLKSYSPLNPGKDNPSTTVHRLVAELNKFLQ